MKKPSSPFAQSPFPAGTPIPFGILSRGKLPLLVLATVASCIVLFALYGFPIPDGDATFFMPPMLGVAKGFGLVNDFAEAMKSFDLSGQNRLVFHGYLYPLLVGRLVWKADYAAIEMLIALINVVTLAATTLLLLMVGSAGKPRLRIGPTVTISAAVVACATTLLGHSGRNETLGAPILVFGLICILSTGRRWHGAICGIVIGLLAGTHPMGCILTVLVISLRVFYCMPCLDGLRFLVGVGLLGVTVWGATFTLYPYSLHDWVFGLINSGRIVAGTPDGMNADLWFRWIASPAATGYGLVYMLAGVTAVSDLSQYWKKVSCKLPFSICGTLLIAAVLNYGYRVPAQNYNLLLFAPLVLAFLVWRSTQWKSEHVGAGLLVRFITTCAFIAASVGFVRSALLFPYFLRYALGREESKHEFSLVGSNNKGKIGMSGGLFTLTGDYEHVKSMDTGTERGYETFVLQQANRGRTEPPEITGYEIVKDRFSRVQPRLFGLKLANTVGGYNFAVYRRKSAAE